MNEFNWERHKGFSAEGAKDYICKQHYKLRWDVGTWSRGQLRTWPRSEGRGGGCLAATAGWSCCWWWRCSASTAWSPPSSPSQGCVSPFIVSCSCSIQKAWGLTVFSPQAWCQDPGREEDPLSWHRGPLVRPHAGQESHREAQPGHDQDIKEDEFSFECQLLLQEMTMVVVPCKNNCPFKI